MLTIKVPPTEMWDEAKSEFVQFEGVTLLLEHSLLSISKWEAKWEKPFISTESKSVNETLDYIRCMTMNKSVKPFVYNLLTNADINRINKYIELPMTATKFVGDQGGSQNRELVTSEMIYYWMISLNIPFECQKWHLNRLITLIRLCSIKSQPPKKMTQREIMAQNAALNAKRREEWKTRG